MDLRRVVISRLFPTPFNLQQARTGAFILLMGLVSGAVCIAAREVQGTLIAVAAVVIGGVLLWMSYSTWIEQRRAKGK